MRLDDLQEELATLVERAPRPAGGGDRAVRSGRARVARRRASVAGVALAVAAVAVIGLVARDDAPHRDLVISTPTNATEAPGAVPAVVKPATDSVIFTSADEGWVCGDPVRHTADGGQTWQAAPYESTEGRVCAGSGGDLWLAVGARAVSVLLVQGGSDLSGPVSFPRLPEDATVTQITFADITHGWVLARTPGDGPGHGFLYRSVQGGLRFDLVSRDAPVNGVTFLDANEGWGIGDGQLEHTTNAGATWSVVPIPVGRPALRSVTAWGSTLVVAGEADAGGTFTPFSLVSTDSGAHFDVRNAPPGLATTDLSGRAFVAVDPAHWRLASGGRLWRTDDGGATWTSDALPVAALSSLAFPTPDVGWAIAGADVLKTSDAGRTWQTVDTAPEPSWSTNLVSVPDNCPTDAVAPVADSPATRAAAEAAARQLVLHARGWTGDLTVVTYRVGERAGDYSGVLAENVPRFCGAEVAAASYGVELSNALVTMDNSRQTALVVGHFADGWKVWGYYR